MTNIQTLIRGAALAALTLCGTLTQAAPVTFTTTSAGGFTIPGTGTSGPANPYPGIIQIAASRTILDVNVTLNGLTHTWSDDLDVLLVGPNGQKVLLMSDVGGSGNYANITLTFDDEAGSFILDSTLPSSGSYKPSNVDADDLFTDAPAGPYGNLLSAFDVSLSNGGWSLFINDDSGVDSGSLDSWSLTLTVEDEGRGIPEPTGLALAGVALLGLAATRLRRR